MKLIEETRSRIGKLGAKMKGKKQLECLIGKEDRERDETN